MSLCRVYYVFPKTLSLKTYRRDVIYSVHGIISYVIPVRATERKANLQTHMQTKANLYGISLSAIHI